MVDLWIVGNPFVERRNVVVQRVEVRSVEVRLVEVRRVEVRRVGVRRVEVRRLGLGLDMVDIGLGTGTL